MIRAPALDATGARGRGLMLYLAINLRALSGWQMVRSARFALPADGTNVRHMVVDAVA
jgi:hypothetical protein